MGQTIVRIFIAIATLTSFTTILYAIGSVINGLVVWDYLTNFFIILQRLMSVFNFMWDMNVAYVIVGWVMVIDISYWVVLAALIVIRRFNKV
jgi:hypothetical protein